MTEAILPGATVGVLGSGQLGRMLAIAARRFGYRVHVYSPESGTPAGQLADREVAGDYLDLERLSDFVRQVDVVTFEFENVPLEAAEAAERIGPVRPSPHVLHTTQNRAREKNFLRAAGLPVAPFATAHSADEVVEVMGRWQRPVIVKQAEWGYDGKGQLRIDSPAEQTAALEQLDCRSVVVEQVVDFQCELSIVAARSTTGALELYGPIVNDHERHILDISHCPAELPAGVPERAREIARVTLEKLDVCGVLCVEMFLTGDGELLINELAPRPHNSGHLTIDAHRSCQFEQQLRAVCGLPLGSSEQLRPAAMANLLGDLWQSATPAWERLLLRPDVKLHLYGKAEPRVGRKMGHLTTLADTSLNAVADVRAARQTLLQPLDASFSGTASSGPTDPDRGQP